MNESDEAPRVGYVPAATGDYCAVQFAKDEAQRWHLGEVLGTTKQHSRIKNVTLRTGEVVKVGPKDKSRVAPVNKLNKQRALAQLLSSPEIGFTTWEEAREHLVPALLREGETSGSMRNVRHGL